MIYDRQEVLGVGYGAYGGMPTLPMRRRCLATASCLWSSVSPYLGCEAILDAEALPRETRASMQQEQQEQKVEKA